MRRFVDERGESILLKWQQRTSDGDREPPSVGDVLRYLDARVQELERELEAQKTVVGRRRALSG